VVGGIVPREQLGQGLLIEFTQRDENRVHGRPAAGAPFDQVKPGPGKGSLEPFRPGE
jgi:hypothetical protein